MDKLLFKCPQCGANLESDGNRGFMFCQFCGHKIMLDQISKSELEIAKMEHEEIMAKIRSDEDRRDTILTTLIVIGVFIILGIMLFYAFTKK